jgi:predicted PurR-regulated permease PerM
MPLIATAMIALLISIEIIYRVYKVGEIENTMTVINSVAVAWFLFLAVAVRCFTRVSKLVCPSLIALVFYYITWIEYDTVNVTIFYKTVIGITMQFFLLVIFNEAWFLTTLVYTPFVCYFMYKSGHDMLDESANTGELVGRCIFLCVIFAIVAY